MKYEIMEVVYQMSDVVFAFDRMGWADCIYVVGRQDA